MLARMLALGGIDDGMRFAPWEAGSDTRASAALERTNAARLLKGTCVGHARSFSSSSTSVKKAKLRAAAR
jgi:hypothetical protein